MGKNIGENKKSSFGQWMKTYVIIWLVLTAGVCAFLWYKLDKYQTGYDKAKQDANPTLVMDVVLFNLQQDNIKSIIDKQDMEVESRFEDKEVYKDFYYDYLGGKTLTYSKDDEKYQDARPVYDVYADDELFAIVSLKSDGEKDEYGFGGWVVDQMAISENVFEIKEAYLQVLPDMTVYVNEIQVGEDELVRSGDIENELSKKAFELTGKQFAYSVYYVGGLVNEPQIKVLDASGNDISDSYVLKEDGLRDYTMLASQEFIDSVTPRVKHFCETYVMHIYGKASLEDVAVMMVDGSEAEALLYNAQSTLAWAWMPENVEILDETFDDFIYYNDNYFTCHSSISIKKSDSEHEETEEFSCQWLFENIGGEWQVDYFTLQ